MERIKELRKTLKLSQDAFGKKLGITGGGVSKIENGERALTEQMALSICREFRVNYFWLTEGKGEMFTGTPQSVVDEIAEDYKLDDIEFLTFISYTEPAENGLYQFTLRFGAGREHYYVQTADAASASAAV